jgi:integrase
LYFSQKIIAVDQLRASSDSGLSGFFRVAVYKREGKKGVAFVCDFIVAGQRVNQTIPGVRNLREAKAAEARMRAEAEARINASGNLVKMSLEVAMERYVAERLMPRSKPAAVANYLIYLGMIRDYFGPSRPVSAINNAACAEWWGALLAGRGGGKGPVKANTAKRYLGQLKAVLAFAAEAGAGNTVPTFSPTVADDARVRWLTTEEEGALLAASPPWLQDMIVFVIETGARKGEMTGLRWRDVDLQQQPRGIVRLYFTKGGEPRGIPMSKRLRALLERLKEGAPDTRPDTPVFQWQVRGAEIWAPMGDFKKSWAAALKAAGIADLHFHDLRHTFASRLVQRAVPLLQVPYL